ncbi:hypothetical protein [Streptomyces sp. UNOB3_S3]|uniref:hypothetical protein n=1 Tax=Streptomyces sp. UNOB3_S3 TaxID=2871682 RepID=UPI001E4B3524|nr:hypothetical protein [Streptomyces sp. UNOB3_S3]
MKRRQSSRRICVEHANAEHRRWRPLQRYTGRRETYAATHRAIAGLVSGRAARRPTRRKASTELRRGLNRLAQVGEVGRHLDFDSSHAAAEQGTSDASIVMDPYIREGGNLATQLLQPRVELGLSPLFSSGIRK